MFVLQTYGVKHWVVHPPTGAPWDLELHPGDVLYLPAGTRHAAQTGDRPSLHLTIGVRTVTWRQVFERVAQRALDDPSLATPLPAGWADRPDHLGDVASELLGELVERMRATDAQGTVIAHAERLVANRPPVLDGAIRDAIEAPSVTDTTALRRRTTMPANLVVDGDRLTLELPGRRISMPSALEPTLQRILTSDRLVPKELDELIDEPSRLVLCRRLVRDGVLTIDHRLRSAW